MLAYSLACLAVSVWRAARRGSYLRHREAVVCLMRLASLGFGYAAVDMQKMLLAEAHKSADTWGVGGAIGTVASLLRLFLASGAPILAKLAFAWQTRLRWVSRQAHCLLAAGGQAGGQAGRRPACVRTCIVPPSSMPAAAWASRGRWPGAPTECRLLLHSRCWRENLPC